MASVASFCTALAIHSVSSGIIVPLVLLICLIVYGLFFPAEQLRNPIPVKEFLKPVTMQVDVASLVKRQRCYESFMIKPLHHNYLFQASWYACDAVELKIGDVLEATFVLKPLHTSHSPGAFDSLQWAKENHIIAQAMIKSAKKIGEKTSIPIKMQHVREKLDTILHDHLSDPAVIAVIESLTLGIRENLSWETVQVFNLSGTRHLLSISGSHIAMVALFAYGIFFALMRFSVIFFKKINAHTAAIALSVLLVGFYVGLSGEQVPTVRAFFMALLSVMALFLQRYSSLLYRILLAAVIVIILDRDILYSPSFYLSFYAVFLIAYHQYWSSNTAGKIRAYLSLNLLLLLGLMPVSLFFFSQYSLVSLVANLIAIPWTGFLLLPGALLLQGFSYLGYEATFFWHALEWLTQQFIATVTFFATITLHVPGLFITGHISLWVAVISSLIILLAFLPKGMPIRYFAFFALLPMIFSQEPILPGHAQLVFMNVGQGLSILVKTKNHLLIYDTGPSFFTGGNVAQSIIIPYLYYRGWNQVDTLMVSHGDSDHAGGVNTLRHYMTIKKTYTSDLDRIPKSLLCQRGQQWSWDGVDFRVLYPDAEHQHQGNNSSCVLRISVGKASALLVGDIEKPAEEYLVNHFSDELGSSLLSVPHHGSKTSSTQAFLSTVHPQFGVFSYGFLNRFHFPSPLVMQRYGEHHILPLITESGPILIEMSSVGVTIFP